MIRARTPPNKCLVAFLVAFFARTAAEPGKAPTCEATRPLRVSIAGPGAVGRSLAVSLVAGPAALLEKVVPARWQEADTTRKHQHL